jgi:hypothetical protein
MKLEGFLESRLSLCTVIPAKAWIQSFFGAFLDSGLRRSDWLLDFLLDHQPS